MWTLALFVFTLANLLLSTTAGPLAIRQGGEINYNVRTLYNLFSPLIPR